MAPRALSGTQSPACAETAGSTPALSTDLKTTCKTNAAAPTKTRRPPILKSRVPVTVPTSQTLLHCACSAAVPRSRVRATLSWVPRGRTTSSSSSLCPPSLLATDETTRTCTLVSHLYGVHVHRTGKGYLYGVQLSRDGSEKSPKCYQQGHPYSSDGGRRGARARRSGRAWGGYDPEVGQGARRDAHGSVLALPQQRRAA